MCGRWNAIHMAITDGKAIMFNSYTLCRTCVAILKLNPKLVEEIRTEVSRVLKHSSPHKPNISKEEQKNLKELRSDKSQVILTAGKGAALVILNKQGYINKTVNLLEQQDTYRTVTTEPTKNRNNLINILKSIKTKGRLGDSIYKRIYAKGMCPHVLWEQTKNIKLEKGECITSYDVMALFISLPVDPAINIIKNKQEQDVEFPNRTSMSISNIIALLGYCLRTHISCSGVRIMNKCREQPLGHP